MCQSNTRVYAVDILNFKNTLSKEARFDKVVCINAKKYAF